MLVFVWLNWLKRILPIILVVQLLLACHTNTEVADNRHQTKSNLSGTIVFWQSFPQSYFTKSLISQYNEVFAEYIKSLPSSILGSRSLQSI